MTDRHGLPRMPVAALLGVLVLASACGTPLWPNPEPRRPAVGAEPGVADPAIVAPPPVTVRAGARSFDLAAWTYCFGNACVDGSPPGNPPDVGDAPEVEVAFPLEGWTFDAEFVPVGDVCPRRQSVPAESTGDGTFVVAPAGPADTYDVTLFGRGDGDLFVTFRWTTPRDGPMPIPTGRLAVLADHDGAVDSYGVELQLDGLRDTPDSAEAEVTVTAANGESISFDAVQAPGCWAEGTIYWDGPDEAGLEAAALGPGPFRYDVRVTLDGAVHTAVAIWPEDQIPGNEPSVALEFAPELPSLP